MKVIVTYTTFTEDSDVMEYITNDYIYQVAKQLNYKVIKATSGKHIDANRPHYHTHVCYDCSGAKMYKTLNEKIGRLFMDLLYPSEDVGIKFKEIEKKISFIYEGQQKKHKKKIILYDESSMCYCFKEYKKNSDIPFEYQTGYSIEEINEMRKIANIYWCEVLRKRNQQKQLDMDKKDEETNLRTYLGEQMIYKKGDVNDLVKHIKHSILKYRKKQYKKGTIVSIRGSALKDQATSFLYFNDYITEEEYDEMYN